MQLGVQRSEPAVRQSISQIMTDSAIQAMTGTD